MTPDEENKLRAQVKAQTMRADRLEVYLSNSKLRHAAVCEELRAAKKRITFLKGELYGKRKRAGLSVVDPRGS
jgi:translation initiation factor IF-1